MDSFISLPSQPPFSFVDAPHGLNSALLLHRKNFPVDHWCIEEFPIFVTSSPVRAGHYLALLKYIFNAWQPTMLHSNYVVAMRIVTITPNNYYASYYYYYYYYYHTLVTIIAIVAIIPIIKLHYHNA